jgi:hypothetical protein
MGYYHRQALTFQGLESPLLRVILLHICLSDFSFCVLFNSLFLLMQIYQDLFFNLFVKLL